MAKKITFLLVMMFVLLIASVTAFAGGSDPTTPETSFTKDKADAEIRVSDLEDKYGQIFLDEKASSSKVFIDISYGREKDGQNELRHNFTGSVVDSTSSPAVMLMYIKKDGKYIPLRSVETGTNITEGTLITCSKVDLEYLGSSKVNEVRIIAFKKSDAGSLALNKNLQITDLQITVRPWNLIEKLNFKLKDIINDLAPTGP